MNESDEIKTTPELPNLRPFVLPPDGSLVRAYGIIDAHEKGIIGVAELSRSALWQLVNEKRFPAPLKVGRVTYWRVEAVKEWLKDPENYRAAE